MEQQSSPETASGHPLAGKPAPPELLIDISALEQAYHERRPDPDDPLQQVSFGTSGHRGTSLDGTFTEAHILAISHAILGYNRANKSHPADGTVITPLHNPPADGGFRSASHLEAVVAEARQIVSRALAGPTAS